MRDALSDVSAGDAAERRIVARVSDTPTKTNRTERSLRGIEGFMGCRPRVDQNGSRGWDISAGIAASDRCQFTHLGRRKRGLFGTQKLEVWASRKLVEFLYTSLGR